METTHTAASSELNAAGERLTRDAAGAASHLKHAAADEIRNLIADVEELIVRLSDLNDADVATVRGKVTDAIESAKEALGEGVETLRRQTQRAVSGADDWVRESPWAAVGLAALVGAVVGILVARRS